MDRARFAPDFALRIDGEPIPAELRASIQSVRCTTGYEGLDEVELTIANEQLRWLDCPLFKLDTAFDAAAGLRPRPAGADLRRRGRGARREPSRRAACPA